MSTSSKHVLAATAIALAFLPAAACGSDPDPATSALTERARGIVEDAVSMRFDEVRDAFDASVAARLTVEDLRQAWDDFLGEHGAVRGIGNAETVEEGGVTVVTFPLEMATKDAEARVTFAPSGKVAGLDFVERGA